MTLRSGPGMSYDALPLELRPGERVVAVEYSPIAYEMERRVGQPWLKIKLADNSEGWIQLEDRVDCGYPPQDAAVRLSSALPAPTSILATPTPRATSTPTSAPTDPPHADHNADPDRYTNTDHDANVDRDADTHRCTHVDTHFNTQSYPCPKLQNENECVGKSSSRNYLSRSRASTA